ncbi:PspC domain-containing protein [Actinoplanes rectilineatus]|uniref:PspC domain-containing protein n=1 Tax=Actinoplanes rectilineatus TaxID=113571 RepID=UPI0005F293E0|nr:PspC domain-containing protein [Actinoplanes rectilineatus]
MNDEAAEPRGPSTPGAGPQDGPAPSTERTEQFTNVPPWVAQAHAAFTRQQLVRPREGRYVAGVCGALARATNTDPVLWRVLLAVLGILGGTGVLLYLIGWLIIASEGDTASPIESLLGKGHSGMTPLSVVLLGGAALLTFAFIVNSGARASMLAAAVIVGAFLLIKRGGATTPAPAPVPPATDTTEEPPVPPRYEPPTFTPSSEGVRPPFAPHGPYASSQPPYSPPPAAPRPPKTPKPPKERSILGRLTFFAVVMVMGVLAAADMAGAGVAVSAYFAAALVTIGLGLLVGAWFGRARGLIFLALLTTIGLVVSTGTERWGAEFRDSVVHPASLAEVADRYEFTFGNVTLDLRDVDFAGAEQNTAIDMKVGQLRVLLPPEVDTTVDVQVGGGRTFLFGNEWNGSESETRSVTDLGTEGAGGGRLTLGLHLDTGNLEVTR